MTRTATAGTLIAVIGFLAFVEFTSGVLQGYYTPMLSDIARHLGIHDADVNWLEGSQLMLSALVVPAFAKLGDMVGRKRMLLISTAIIGANYVDSTAWVIAFLAVAFFGNGLASITWSLVSTLAPARLLGLTGGVFNFIGNLSAIATPIVIGFLASGDSFAPAITYIAVLALLGALSYVLLVGKVERIELK